MNWETFKYFLKKVTKKSLNNSFACNIYFLGKGLVVINNNPFGSYFDPNLKHD